MVALISERSRCRPHHRQHQHQRLMGISDTKTHSHKAAKRIAGTARRAVLASVQIAPLATRHLKSQCAMKNLAGFNRDFRFTPQKHICAAAKRRRGSNVTTQKSKKILKKDIYETHTNSSSDRVAEYGSRRLAKPSGRDVHSHKHK